MPAETRRRSAKLECQQRRCSSPVRDRIENLERTKNDSRENPIIGSSATRTGLSFVKAPSEAGGRRREYPCYSLTFLKRSEFVITDTELKLMAAAARIGLSSKPNNGNSTPAAIGTPIEL